MNKNLVSIVMNCHNGEKYLKDAVNSILKQSYNKWELIFFDNASTDSSAKIIKDYKDKRIKYFYSKFVNLGIARKKALDICKGQFIAFLDCDDYWDKNKLKIQVKELVKYHEVGVSFSNSYFFKGNKKKLLYEKQPIDGSIFKNLLEKYYISFDTVIIKKKILDKLSHKFDERFTITHDLDLLIRLSMITRFKYINQVLSYWRIHEFSFSQNKISTINKEKEFFKKIEKILKLNKNKKLYINLFKANLNQSLIEEYIVMNKKVKFIKLFFKIKSYNLKNLILLLIIFIPGGGTIYKKLKKSW